MPQAQEYIKSANETQVYLTQPIRRAPVFEQMILHTFYIFNIFKLFYFNTVSTHNGQDVLNLYECLVQMLSQIDGD